jgi:hypothetical protein
MARDSIVDEVRKVRQAYAARFDFNLEAICQDLAEKERQSTRKKVSFSPRRASEGEPVRSS